MIKRYYAGIGSRETPEVVGILMGKIAKYLSDRNYILRSGGAPGADTFFEQVVPEHSKEIYLPWKGFNANSSPRYKQSIEAFELAQRIHPAWDKLTEGGKKMMARNCYQIMGQDLNTPVDFVVCWTSDGKSTGGTGQAMRLAEIKEIPIYNLYHEAIRNKFVKKVEKM